MLAKLFTLESVALDERIACRSSKAGTLSVICGSKRGRFLGGRIADRTDGAVSNISDGVISTAVTICLKVQLQKHFTKK